MKLLNSNGDLCTAVFDASGNKFALEAGPDYMSHGGRFVLVGLSKGDLTQSPRYSRQRNDFNV